MHPCLIIYFIININFIIYNHEYIIGSNYSSSPNEEASILGVRLHKMVKTALHGNVHIRESDSPQYTSSVESKYNNTTNCKEDVTSEGLSVCTDDAICIADKHDVEKVNLDKKEENDLKKEEVDYHNGNTINIDKKMIIPLPCKISSKSLAKVRANPITLSSKKSFHEVLILQSTDTNIVEMNKALPQTLKSELSMTSTKNNKTSTTIPFQITTVGYAFPNFLLMNPKSTSSVQMLVNKCGNKSKNNIDKPIQVTMDLENKEEQFIQTSNDSEMFNYGLLKQVLQDEPSQTDKHSTTNFNQSPKEVKSKQIATDTLKDMNMDCTSSLDMLVNLLNEIQNITTCQTQMTNSLHLDDEAFNVEYKSKSSSNILFEKVKKPLDSNKSLCRDIISITSLDKMRHLESLTSIYSFYLSNDSEIQGTIYKVEPNVKFKNVACDIIPTLVQEKEVNVDISEKYVNRCTEVPSRLFPVTTNRSTTVTNSLLGIFSQPSSLSLFQNINNYETYSIYSLKPSRKIIEIPIENRDFQIKDKKRCSERKLVTVCNNNTKKHKAKCLTIARYKTKIDQSIPQYSITGHNKDPLIKMKRDILVTVYSVLVLTVFAALSFPEICMNVTNHPF